MKQSNNFQVLGELLLSVCHQPLASRLSVTVVQARNLPKISNYGVGGKYASSIPLLHYAYAITY